MADEELTAMHDMLSIMERLDQAAQGRTIAWLSEKLGVRSVAGSRQPENERFRLSPDRPSAENEYFRDFADLFDAAHPKTDVDKALIAGYWVQIRKGSADFASQSINDELKQLGHPVGNITRALGALIRVRPSLVQQLRKDGGSKQARKTYRLTSAGQKRVEQMCGRRADDDRQSEL